MIDRDLARLATDHEVSYCAFMLGQQSRLSGHDVTNRQRITWLRMTSGTRTHAKSALVEYIVALLLARGGGGEMQTFTTGTELSDCVDNPAIAGQILRRAKQLSYHGDDLEWLAEAVSARMRSHENTPQLQANIVKSYSITSLMIVPVRAEVPVS